MSFRFSVRTNNENRADGERVARVGMNHPVEVRNFLIRIGDDGENSNA